MTDEQLSEILAHPRTRAYFLRLVEEEPRMRAYVAGIVIDELRRFVPRLLAAKDQPTREAPPGWLTYYKAAERHKDSGVKYQTIRHAVHQKAITGGLGLVEITSLDAWAASRRTKKRRTQ